MHFLFFSAQYLPTAGGVERYTHELAATLCGMGHRATVVTSALPGQPTQETDAKGIAVHRLPAHLFMQGRFPCIRPGASFRALAGQLFDAHDFDFAVINTRFYPLSLWAARQCHKRNIPAIVLEHGTKHLSLDNAFLNLIGNAYEHLAMRYVRRYCQRFYGVSQACVRWLEHFHVKAEGVLYNAVDAATLQEIATKPPVIFRHSLNVADSTLIIGFVGRFIVEKGIRELLSAFALVREQFPQALLVMAGAGPLWDEVQAKSLPGVVLLGNVPFHQSIALMAQANAFCLPTYSEGFSSTVLEAAAVSACIVTTPTGGSPELIESGTSGVLLENILPATIAKALCLCLEDPVLCQSMGKAAAQTVSSKFTWPSTARSLLRIAAPTQRNTDS